MGTCRRSTKRYASNLIQNCTCGISKGFCAPPQFSAQTGPGALVVAQQTGMPANDHANNLIRELHLWNLHSFLRCLAIGARHNDGHVNLRTASCGICTGNTTIEVRNCTCRCTTTGMHCWTKNGNCGASQFSARPDQNTVQRTKACHPCPKTATVGSSRTALSGPQQRAWTQTGPRAAPGESQRSAAQFALRVPASVSRSAQSQLGRPLAPLDNGRGMCIRDRGCKRPTLHNGSGLYLFHNNRRKLQDGCRDEHRDVRILRTEAL